MEYYDFNVVYETEVNGEIYCFRYADPETHNGGRTFSVVAQAWKKGTEDYFLVSFSVPSEEIDETYFRIIKGIKKKVNE